VRDSKGRFIVGNKDGLKTVFKIGHPANKMYDANNGRWKGDDVGYNSLHEWVIKRLGRPSLCNFCGTLESGRFEWANLSGKYQRDLKDWARLCNSCHQKYDKGKLKVGGLATLTSQ